MTGKTLLIIVNEDRYFVSHRMEVARGALAAGWRVVVAAAPIGGCRKLIESEGMEFVPLPLHGDGIGLYTQMATLRVLVRLFRRERRGVIHLVGMKMLLVGNAAARIARSECGMVNAVCGLGGMFIDPSRRAPRLLLRLLRMIWRRGNVLTIVQNHDDEALLRQAGVITPEETVYIKGSGVDLSLFTPSYEKPKTGAGKRRVIFTGRLLKSKGVEDFVKTAELLRPALESNTEFLICGRLSSNCDSMTGKRMQQLCDGHYIRWTGFREDIPTILAESDIMLYPSYYREGVPLSLIEASAAGLPIVTCDSPGCRDTIDGNGFLIPPHSPERIAEAIMKLLENPALAERLGRKSREIAERDYDIKEVVSRHLSLYDSFRI